MNNITIRDLKKRGFVATPELNFHDDGTNFKMLSYKGLPVSYTKVDGDYYIALRPDYLESGYAYSDLTAEARTAMDKYNGVSSVDLDDLVAGADLLRAELGL